MTVEGKSEGEDEEDPDTATTVEKTVDETWVAVLVVSVVLKLARKFARYPKQSQTAFRGLAQHVLSAGLHTIITTKRKPTSRSPVPLTCP